MLQGAVIGCGFFAQNHLLAWNALDGVQLAAVCDLNAGKAAAAAELTGARPYTDLGTMLASERLDFVDVATTMESHEAILAKAAERSVPAICQKPLAPDIATCRRIVARAAAAGAVLMVHENFRFQRPMQEVRRLLDEGVVGMPFFAHVAWRTGYDVVAGQPYLAAVERFILLDLGIHVLDIARFLMGEVREVYARTQRTLPGAVGESQATMLLTHESGAMSEVACTYTMRAEPDPFPQTLLEIEGDRGTLRLLADYRLELHREGDVEVLDVSPRPPDWADARWGLVQESVQNTQAHFLACLRDGTEPSTSGGDNLLTFALVEAAYASAEQGQPVRPEP